MENPEYLLLFPNDGPYRVTVRIQGVDRNAVADRQMTAHEVTNLIARGDDSFFSCMKFDERPCEVYKYEIDPIKKILTIRARSKLMNPTQFTNPLS